MRKTKIICTIGPTSEGLEQLKQMIEAGMNVARLNFSHGNYDEHAMRIARIRQASQEVDFPVSIMLDTRGPEIRTGRLENSSVQLKAGQRFVLTGREVPGNENEVQVSYGPLASEVGKGSTILLADGLINLQVEDTIDDDLICSVVNGGVLGERKGINVPGVRINMPFLSAKDIADINFGIDQEVDFIAASFVRSAEDVLEIRRILEQRNADIDIIAKIESQGAVENLEDIIKVADGIMVARGDLGVEIPAEDVPLVQRKVVAQCNYAGKIVIIATQMLDSMIHHPRPTRAEVSDVANAIFDGADAVMLSGETAAGQYPLAAVETMARVAKRTEGAFDYQDLLIKKAPRDNLSVTDAISYACCATASYLNVLSIITPTQTGLTARMIAKYRPEADILAVTSNEKVLRRLTMVWGVHPVLARETSGTDELLDEALSRCLDKNYIKRGDMVVLSAGSPTGVSGGTNLIKVHIVGEIMASGMGIGGPPVSGTVKVIINDNDLEKIKPGDIIVTNAANAAFSPYLDKVKAIITEAGGLTSDAAIMGLNVGIPVIVGCANATTLFADNMLITVDTPNGRIYKGLTKVL